MGNKRGKVWLVGAGPGDSGLLTLKGFAVLQQADTVVYDNLVGSGVLAMIPTGTEMIDVGKKAGNHPVPQNEINEILLEKAVEGKKVVRLKGGDPFLFGRGGEELELLTREGIALCARSPAIAVPAYSGSGNPQRLHRRFTSSPVTPKGQPRCYHYPALVRSTARWSFSWACPQWKAGLDYE